LVTLANIDTPSNRNNNKMKNKDYSEERTTESMSDEKIMPSLVYLGTVSPNFTLITSQNPNSA
jgi:hypothetical protein